MDYREWRDGVHDNAAAIGLLEADPSMDNAIYRESWLELDTPEDHAYWGGRVRKGMLFIHEARTGDLPSTLRISVVSHAVYARDFPIDTLRYVYVHSTYCPYCHRDTHMVNLWVDIEVVEQAGKVDDCP